MSRRPARDPNLEILASAVQETRRTKKRPPAAARSGPLVAIVVIALAGGAGLLTFFLAHDNNPAVPVSVSDLTAKPVGEQPGAQPDVKPIQAVSNPRTSAASEEQAVVVSIVSAKIEPIELFPAKKMKAAAVPTTQSKLFGKIPEPDDRPTSSRPLLAIRVRVQNKSGAPVEYRSWNEATPPLLSDDAQNVYGFCQFTSDYLPVGPLQGTTSLRPGQSVEDLLIFERPPATIRSLDLRLPGRNVGTPQPIIISISSAQITGL